MEIFKSLDQVQRNDNCVLTIGTFDGVHLGHQAIIDTLHKSIDQQGEYSTIVTFEPHPQFVVSPPKSNELRLLTTIDEKITILQQLKINRLIILPFDRQLSQLSSEAFIEKILIPKIGFKKIVIGYDHAFGKDRQGNYEVLQQQSAKYHYSIITVPPFSVAGVVISSTRIRKLLANGEIELAAKYLGRNYSLIGKVIKGEGRGRTLNIPTANIEPMSREKLIPRDGIYAAWTQLDHQKFKAVLYIGSKPTFSYHTRTIELHIFDLNEDLYGQTLTIEFKARIRDDYYFDQVEKLIDQIEIDKKQTLEILIN